MKLLEGLRISTLEVGGAGPYGSQRLAAPGAHHHELFGESEKRAKVRGG